MHSRSRKRLTQSTSRLVSCSTMRNGLRAGLRSNCRTMRNLRPGNPAVSASVADNRRPCVTDPHVPLFVHGITVRRDRFETLLNTVRAQRTTSQGRLRSSDDYLDRRQDDRWDQLLPLHALILTDATLPTYGCNTAQIPAAREQRTSSLAEDELIELLGRVDAVSRSASRVLHAHSPDREHVRVPPLRHPALRGCMNSKLNRQAFHFTDSNYTADASFVARPPAED
jgi:hypothetical protein